MGKTLILLFHRNIADSKANAALASAAVTLDGVEVVDMYALFPQGNIDWGQSAEAEAQRLLQADHIVLQFPVQWYSTPPLLKAWQDAVLTRMYYLHSKTEGDVLAGTPLMIAATAGNTAEAYHRSGSNYYSMDEIMTPLKAVAHRCGLPWHEPCLIYTADKLEPGDLAAACEQYVEALKGLSARSRSNNGPDGAYT